MRLLPLDVVEPLSEEQTETLRETLSSTAWDGPAESISQPRAGLYSAFGLECLSMAKAAGPGKVVSLVARAGDENESYGALLDGAARCG
jgi:hypothetical protein